MWKSILRCKTHPTCSAKAKIIANPGSAESERSRSETGSGSASSSFLSSQQEWASRASQKKKQKKRNPKPKSLPKVIKKALSCFTDFLSCEALTNYNVYSLFPEDYWSLLQAFYARLRGNSAEFHVYKAWQQFNPDFTINIMRVWVQGTYFPMLPSNGFFLRGRERQCFILTVKRSHLKQCGLSHQARHPAPASLFEFGTLYYRR